MSSTTTPPTVAEPAGSQKTLAEALAEIGRILGHEGLTLERMSVTMRSDAGGRVEWRYTRTKTANHSNHAPMP